MVVVVVIVRHTETKAIASDSKMKIEMMVKKPYQCEMCSIRFSQNTSLNSHLTSVHGGKKVFSCTHCDAKLFSQKTLKRHMKSVQEKEKPHQCTICDTKFSEECKLNQHVSVVHDSIFL